jgi:2-iminobutanoate/2-iminopropanoate deaminase
MTPRLILAAALALSTLGAAQAAWAAEPANRHFPVATPTTAGAQPPFSASVLAGNTLYVSGTTDMDPATGKPPPEPADGARRVMDNIKRSVEAAGMSMDDLAWVQVFTSDLSYYAAFNTVYRTYFKGPMPARAFIGAGSLLGGAHFEVMGVAVKAGK